MRQMKMWAPAALLGASIALGACGGSDTANTDTQATAAGEVAPGTVGGVGDSGAMDGDDMGELASLSAPDIMAVVGASNAAEIGSSKVAVEKATSADVKAFAQKMVKEHQAMQGEADQLATRLNVTPGTPDRAQDKTEKANEVTEDLRGATRGAEFDREYMEAQVQAHQQTLAELQAMQNTTNADVANLIKQAIPKVQAHLEEAQRIHGQLSGAGAAGATGATGMTPSGR